MMLQEFRFVSEQSIVHFVEAIIQLAITQHASDIHIESVHNGVRIRYRIDGVLYDQPCNDATRYKEQLFARIKVLSHLDITQKRVPQDGKFCFDYNQKTIDLRVSTFPSLHGEKIVIRILDRSKQAINIDSLGLDESILSTFTDLVKASSGFVLVTGPTGSGKTTTLYAALSLLNEPEKNILTLEDPIEYNLPGITQSQIHPPAGFTFERGMRSLLRQDPDIAMIGEVRDKLTARIAIEAALTGHMVFSTLHTMDAPSAVMRLMDMGIESYLLNASLTGVLAQRLVRKLCDHCKTERPLTSVEQECTKKYAIALESTYDASGCDACFNTGFKGRLGIFELLVVSNELRSLIVQQPNVTQIYAQVLHDGMKPLLQNGLKKVQEGTISLAELMRVIL